MRSLGNGSKVDSRLPSVIPLTSVVARSIRRLFSSRFDQSLARHHGLGVELRKELPTSQISFLIAFGGFGVRRSLMTRHSILESARFCELCGFNAGYGRDLLLLLTDDTLYILESEQFVTCRIASSFKFLDLHLAWCTRVF